MSKPKPQKSNSGGRFKNYKTGENSNEKTILPNSKSVGRCADLNGHNVCLWAYATAQTFSKKKCLRYSWDLTMYEHT